MSLFDSFANLASALIVAALSAWIAVQLSLRSFYAHRWRETRFERYVAVIEALHHLKNYSSHEIDAEFRGTQLTKDRKEELFREYRQAEQALWKLTDTGSFFFSRPAVGRLRRLIRDLDNAKDTESWFEHLDTENAVVRKALDDFMLIARKDLGLKDEERAP